MYHTFHPIIVYSSVVFSIFMELCSHHHYWISGNLLIPPAKKSHIHSSCFSFPLNTLSPSYLLYFITIPVSFFFHLCILWDTIILKLSQLIILHWPLSVQVKGRIACISLYIREGSGTPLQYSCLENPMDGGAWWAAVHGVAKSRTRLSDFTFTFPFRHWRRKWQPTPGFLTGESQGQGSLVGCRPWGHKESDTT